MPRLSGKVALITGAASGFGEAIAHAFATEGAHVLVADIAAENGHRVVNEINSLPAPNQETNAEKPPKAIFVALNVTNTDHWTNALQTALTTFGQLDIVVNNAGTTYAKKPSVEVTEDEFDKVLAVNVKSIFLSVKVVMPYFMQRKKEYDSEFSGGVFLNTSSVAGTRVRPGQVFYGGTKGFLNTVTQGLAAEYGPYGVRVNSICPLGGATGLLELFSGVKDTPEERERFGRTVPLGRMSEPRDIALAAVYLASDEAAFISGVNLPVDGGRLAV